MNDSHQKIKNILHRQFEASRLAHAYLFVGPKGTGKTALAEEFGAKVLNTPKEDLARHADYSVLDCGQGLTAEVVREFIGRIALKPFVARRKFALIRNIENLNIQSANALLKTLEEPPESTVMVLTAETRRILPTIISRCQMFNFNRGSHAERGAADHTRKEAPLISDLAGKSLAERLLSINQFADLEEIDLKQAIENFIYQSAEGLSFAPQKYPHLAAGLKAFEDLQTNKNTKLILQGLFLRI